MGVAMTLWPLITLLFLGINAGLVVLNGVLSWRLWRWHSHAVLLDHLLMRICVDAFRRQSQPVWSAWRQSMGDISVEIRATRKQSMDE
jgi:hypothetical protein